MDISMCGNQECTLKEKCFRFKCEPETYQAYGDFQQDEKGECKYYWPFNSKEEFEKFTLENNF